MTILNEELKTRARFLMKKLNGTTSAPSSHLVRLSRRGKWDIPEVWQHKHTLNLIALDCGFHHWEHARRVLGGEALRGEDMGDFWIGKGSLGFTNLWFTDYVEAVSQLQVDPNCYLLPYRQQFVVASCEYLVALGVIEQGENLPALERDFVKTYGTQAWLDKSFKRLQTSRHHYLHPYD